MSVAVAQPVSLLSDIQRDGIALVPGLSTAQVGDIWSSLRYRKRYAGHVKRGGRPHEGQPISCWGMHDVVAAPHFWEFALGFTLLAGEYLGTDPLLYSVNAYESLPSGMDPHPGVEVFHRDRDDIRFLALFVYLTDSKEGDGSHLFQCGTHDGGPVTCTAEVCGPRGTAFLADTRGLHCGVRPKARPRRIAWARWGVSDPPASYTRDQLQPMSRERMGRRYPSGQRLRDLVRLVVA